MTRREALALILLILLGLTGPVVLLVRGMTQGAVRRAEWEAYRRIPYEGTARELFAEHGELLTDAAEILWAHPEWMERYRRENESDAAFPWSKLMRGEPVAHPFAEDEWQTLLRLSEQRWLLGLWYYWGRVPVISCSVFTEEPGMISLTYIRSEGFSKDAVQAELRYHMSLEEWYERIGETDWYIRCFISPL